MMVEPEEQEKLLIVPKDYRARHNLLPWPEESCSWQLGMVNGPDQANSTNWECEEQRYSVGGRCLYSGLICPPENELNTAADGFLRGYSSELSSESPFKLL